MGEYNWNDLLMDVESPMGLPVEWYYKVDLRDKYKCYYKSDPPVAHFQVDEYKIKNI